MVPFHFQECWENIGCSGYYRQASNTRRIKSQNLNVSRVALQLSLAKPLKPAVKSSMKMSVEQRRQAMFHLHLSDQQFY